MALATTFVSTLGSILGHLIDKKSASERKFRVALHRLVRFDGDEVFQQITPYAGRVENKSGIGRFFPVKAGIVGLACRTGSLVVARRRDSDKFNKIWELTALRQSGANNIKPYVDSLFACPFFAPEHGNEFSHVSLVLFADSQEPDFFDNDVLGTIFAACHGFVNLLEKLHTSGTLKPVPTFYSGFKFQLNPDLQQMVSELKRLGVAFKGVSDRGWKEGLTFETLKSLELEVGRFTKIA